mmetsp:Transcript_8928/g.39470  ORF Transcript_8928/g.39470 Transcript_8928/m.39470 type:complete len:285 (-) Transcript_8928:720-1574(-)|eukprot:CAMPEP_0113966896 /NCGR_PEP_ID=MMETSP0011_2-20120614/8568_1 /TAXON_ID=101924 /ORGANISM="Rhodosorus marinus" /LENGTH=284 /DNA_ID=CAMNT_0000979597 /DNA_START=149 /DNA_END=1003 /DNA_ORIENTATION=+ /assembly_acc=CAM_ASM_000156
MAMRMAAEVLKARAFKTISTSRGNKTLQRSSWERVMRECQLADNFRIDDLRRSVLVKNIPDALLRKEILEHRFSAVGSVRKVFIRAPASYNPKAIRASSLVSQDIASSSAVVSFESGFSVATSLEELNDAAVDVRYPSSGMQIEINKGWEYGWMPRFSRKPRGGSYRRILIRNLPLAMTSFDLRKLLNQLSRTNYAMMQWAVEDFENHISATAEFQTTFDALCALEQLNSISIEGNPIFAELYPLNYNFNYSSLTDRRKAYIQEFSNPSELFASVLKSTPSETD